MLVSFPKHCTLSMAKVLETGPKNDLVVALPLEYPNILGTNYSIYM